MDVGHLSGTQWHFVVAGGTQVPSDVPATLRFRGNHASGMAGCNAYGASFHVAADGTAALTQDLSTQVGCLQPPGATQLQRGIFAGFRNTAKVATDNGELVMFDAAGKPLAKLAPVDSH